MQTRGKKFTNEKIEQIDSETHASETHFSTCNTLIVTIWCREMIV
jgi:hypothetical protein